jgi:hypothetical protein
MCRRAAGPIGLSTDSKNDADVGSIVKDPPLQPAGCRVASLCAASASRTLVNTASASLPSPPPLPLVASRSHPPRLVVVLSSINLQLCNRHPSPLTPMVGCCVFRPLHPLSSMLRGLTSHCAIASHSASLVPLVRLVVASPLLTPPPPICRHFHLSSRRHLSLRHGLPYLLSSWLLHSLYSCRHLPSAGVSASHCAVASHRAMASRTSCPAGCCVASAAHPLGAPWRAPPAGCRVASAAHPLGAPLPLDVPSSRCAPASRRTTSTSHLLFAFCLPWLVVTLVLVTPPLPPILLTCNCLSTRQLIVALCSLGKKNHKPGRRVSNPLMRFRLRC